ncbi:glycosyl hydrolase family 16 [Mycobacterium sp. BK086]|nr:glycosyl hydrolase family 16 [Mycobacterium sp. BK086]
MANGGFATGGFAVLGRGVLMRWSRSSHQLGLGALVALGFGASVTVGCAVAAADTGSAADGSTASGTAHSRQSVASSHVSATSAQSARPSQPKAVVAGARTTRPQAAVGSTGRRVAALVVPEPAAATTTVRSMESASATKSASALANPFSFLNSIARQIQVKFFNRTPTLTYDGSDNVIHDDGTITGQVVGNDADGDALKYSVSTAAKGTVTIDGSGNFTFTPGDDFVSTTGDIFTATVSDATPGQFHGLMGMLVPGWGSTAKLTAKVLGAILPPGDPGSVGPWGTPSRTAYFTDLSVLSDWWVYNGRTQHGNRTPNQITFADGIMTLNGDANGNDAGIAWGPGQKYGAWEVRVKIPAGAPNYDPVLLLWPDAENWPTGGEIDFMEIWGDGSRQAVNSVLHYGATNQQAGATKVVDATQWHTYAVSWTPTQITTYVDGTPIFTTTDTSTFPPGPMHLCIQLDMLGSDISAGAQMQVAWAKEYSYASFT